MVPKFRPVLAVATGGAVGSLARWLILFGEPDDDVRLFLLNVVGSVIVGAAAGRREHLTSSVHTALTVGLAGGLTTFSTFAVSVARHIDNGQLGQAAIHGLSTPILAVLAAGIAYRVSRWSATLNRRPNRRAGTDRGTS